MLPFIAGKDKGAPHETLYWRFGEQMAIRKGDFKLVKYDLAAEGGKGTSAVKLYDLGKDIGEAKDLTATMPEKVKELQTAWSEWDKANIKPLWGGGSKGGGDGAEPDAPKKKKKKAEARQAN
ncbi:MAG: atsA 11 [Verrucomicrobia bacterium]|nr:atsA 11 [Verrucomicrobiota bacterium]